MTLKVSPPGSSGAQRAEPSMSADTPADTMLLGDASGLVWTLFENAPIACAIADAGGVILRVNHSFIDLLGYGPSEITGKTTDEITHAEEQGLSRAQNQAVGSGQVDRTQYEKRYRCKDGSLIWVLVTLSGVDVGGSRYVIAQIVDITSRLRSEQPLRESNERLQTATEGAGAGIWDLDLRTQKMIWDGTARRQYGLPSDEPDPDLSAWLERLHADDRATVAAKIEASQNSGAANFDADFRVPLADGSLRWHHAFGRIFRDAAGTAVRASGINLDITDARRMQQQFAQSQAALAASEQRFRAMTENAADIVVLADARGQITYVSASVRAIAGYAPEEMLGRSMREFVDPDTGTELARKFAAILRDPGRVDRAERWYRHKNGELRLFESVSRNLLLDPAVAGVVVNLRDITERRKAEEDKLAEFKRAERQLAALSQVTASAALIDGDVETFARQVTEAAARATGAARVNAWLFNEGETELQCIDLFETTAARHSSGQRLQQSAYYNEFQALKNSRYIDAGDAQNDPRTAGYVDSYLKPLGITSMLDAVIETSGKHLGLLCIEHVDRPHHWEADEISFASQLADKLGLCIANRSRQQASSELREAQRVAHLGNWQLHLASGEVSWSDEVYRIFGRDPGTAAPMLNQHPELMTADSYARLDAAIVGCQRTGVLCQVELELPHADGERRWVVARGEAQRDVAGVIVALRGTVQDITERKRSEDALRAAQRITEDILNAIPVRVFWKDRALAYQGCNAAFARDAGFSSPNEVIGKNDNQMVWRDQAESYRADDRAVIDSGKAKLFVEEPQTVADGSTVTLLTSKLPLRDARGEISGVLGTYMDITEHKRQEQALRRTSRALAALSRGSGALVHAQSETGLYDAMTRAIVEAGGYRMAWVGLAEHGQDRAIRPVGTAGDSTHYSEQAKISWGDGERGAGPVGECVRSGQMQICPDMATDARVAPWRQAALAAGFKAMVALPLKDDSGQTFGVLCIYTNDPADLDPQELPLLQEMAADLAYGIGHLRAADQRRAAMGKLRLSLEGTISALGATMEARDPYTAGHQRHVARLAEAIGTQMGLSAQIVQGLHFGSMIHDIGKIQVPSEILTKPTRLSKPEFELIKTHPQAGYDIVKDIEFPWPIALMVLQHHERLDGSGYPQGLKAAQIILEARIIAVADVVEAMFSHRPYRPGLGIEAALAEIESRKGSWFDPAAVEACLKLFREQHFTL